MWVHVLNRRQAPGVESALKGKRDGKIKSVKKKKL
jgi:hypothetical protein